MLRVTCKQWKKSGQVSEDNTIAWNRSSDVLKLYYIIVSMMNLHFKVKTVHVFLERSLMKKGYSKRNKKECPNCYQILNPSITAFPRANNVTI